jgi:hypothetical protein
MPQDADGNTQERFDLVEGGVSRVYSAPTLAGTEVKLTEDTLGLGVDNQRVVLHRLVTHIISAATTISNLEAKKQTNLDANAAIDLEIAEINAVLGA